MAKQKTIEVADPFARQLMSRYLQRRRDDVDRLRSALQGGDFEQLRITGHNLFGSGSAYGLDEISRLGEKIEDAAEAGDSTALGGLIAALERWLDEHALAR